MMTAPGVVDQMVAIMRKQPGCRWSEQLIREAISGLEADFQANVGAEKRRDPKVPAGDVKKAAKRLEKACDMFLSIIGPEADPEWAESPAKARLEDALIYELDRGKSGLARDVWLFTRWREAARRIAAGVSGVGARRARQEDVDEAMALVKRAIYGRQGGDGKPGERPLTISENAYQDGLINLWEEATGQPFHLRSIGGESKQRNKAAASDRAQYLKLGLRLIGINKSLSAIQSGLKRRDRAS